MAEKETSVRVTYPTREKLRKLTKVLYTTTPKLIDMMADRLLAELHKQSINEAK